MQAYLSMMANRAVDDYAIGVCGIPGNTLMKNAGMAVVQQMAELGYLSNTPQIVVLAGHGNNGGDGYVIAAELKRREQNVSLITVVAEKDLKGDALYHFQLMKKAGLESSVWKAEELQVKSIQNAHIIIDALLGTGIQGELRSPYKALIELANSSPAKIVAVDVPSGVVGDTGAILEPCIGAELTISMGYGKQGCLFEPARSRCGQIVPVDIGFPAESLEQVQDQILYKLEYHDFPAINYTRANNSHKYSSGKVLVIAGSKGFTGAAILASKGALRSGSGLVRLAIPESLGAIAECSTLETVVDYLPETDTQGLTYEALSDLQKAIDWADTVALGPGLGRHPDTMKLVQHLIQSIHKPLVLDADGLFALNEDPSILLNRKGSTLLTPHAGEFKRLASMDSDSSPTWQNASTFAQKYSVSVILKGAPSILASPNGEVRVNSAGYAGMATGGSGDVLSGVCASLWAQWPDDPQILTFAMHIHSKAADCMREEKGVLGLIASDIIDGLPKALKEYGGLPV